MAMRSLYLCRHAQAGENATDSDRELTDEGKDQAAVTAAAMVKDRARPDIMICSPAKRAIQTAVILAQAMEYPEQRIVIAPCLYEQDFETILKYLRGLNRELCKVMIVGHNPTVSGLASWLTGKPAKLVPGAYTRVMLTQDNWPCAIRFQAANKSPRPKAPVEKFDKRLGDSRGYRSKKSSKA